MSRTDTKIRADAESTEQGRVSNKESGFHGVSVFHSLLPYISYKFVYCMPVFHALLHGMVDKFVKYMFRPLPDMSKRGRDKAAGAVETADALVTFAEAELKVAQDAHAAMMEAVDRDGQQQAGGNGGRRRRDPDVPTNAQVAKCAAAFKAKSKLMEEATSQLTDAAEALRLCLGSEMPTNIVLAAGRVTVSQSKNTLILPSEFGRGFRDFMQYT